MNRIISANLKPADESGPVPALWRPAPAPISPKCFRFYQRVRLHQAEDLTRAADAAVVPAPSVQMSCCTFTGGVTRPQNGELMKDNRVSDKKLQLGMRKIDVFTPKVMFSPRPSLTVRVCVRLCVRVCVPAGSWPSERVGWPHNCASVRPLLSAAAQSRGRTAGPGLSEGPPPPGTDSRSAPAHIRTHTAHVGADCSTAEY